MQKALRTITVAAVVFAGTLSNAAAETITLKVSATPSIFKPMFEGFVTAFEAENTDIRIDLDASVRDQSEMIQALLRKALVKDLPDVSFQGYNFLRVLADRDLAVPLNQFVANDPGWNPETFTTSITASGTIDETVYGLGVGMSFPIIYYNADLVGQAQGGTTAIPSDWELIVDLARKIDKSDAKVLGASIRSHPWVFQGLVESMGGRMMAPGEKEIAFNGDAGMKAFELLRMFGEAGQAKADMSRQQSRQAFVSGNVGMLIDSSSILDKLEKQAAGKFTVGTSRLPVPATDGRLAAAGVASVMLTRDAARQEAAWKFMRFVASPEGQVIVGKNTGYVPANGIAAQRPDLLGDYYAERANMGAAIASLPFATSWYAFPGENAVKIGKTIENYMTEVVTLRQTPEDAMQALTRDVIALLPK